MDTNPTEVQNSESLVERTDIGDMKRPELVKTIFDLLEKHSRPGFPLTYTSFNYILVGELRRLYMFLSNPSAKKGSKKRPLKIPSAGKTTYPYKIEMNDYIADHWGWEFESLSIVTSSLLEAAVNYLVGIYVPRGDAFAYRGKGILVMGPPAAGKTVLVNKFLKEEPGRTKLIADDRPYVAAKRRNKPIILHEEQVASSEKSGHRLDVIVHLDIERSPYQVEDISYEQAIEEFRVPNGRLANSMQRVRFVKSGMVPPKTKIEYGGYPEAERAVLMSVALIHVLPDPKELHDFYLHMREVILDRVA
jgi:hypothetical protein